jgi:hypothetical protein
VIKMKVLIVVSRNPAHRYLVNLHTEELIQEVTKLIGMRKHSQAIVSALSKGRFEREVAHHEVPKLSANLILTEDSVRWDLTR